MAVYIGKPVVYYHEDYGYKIPYLDIAWPSGHYSGATRRLFYPLVPRIQEIFPEEGIKVINLFSRKVLPYLPLREDLRSLKIDWLDEVMETAEEDFDLKDLYILFD